MQQTPARALSPGAAMRKCAPDCLAVTPPPLGAMRPMIPLLVAYRLVEHPVPLGATPVN